MKEEEEFFESVTVVDHRAEDQEVLNKLRSSLGLSFEFEYDSGKCMVEKGGVKFHVPLTETRHDKYIIISSIAEIFKNDYTFYLSDNSIEDDTHYLKVFPSNETRNEIGVWEYTFVPLDFGYDYFNGIDIPYIGHDDNNPDFDWEAEQLNEGLSLIRPVLVKENLRQLKEGNLQPKSDSCLRDDDKDGLGAFGRALRIQLGTASAKDKFIYYGSRYWWLLLVFAWLYWR